MLIDFPPSLRRVIQRKRFWTDYLFLTDPELEGDGPPYPDLANTEVTVRVSADLALALRLDSDAFCTSLDLLHPDPDPVAWDDQAHWHPHLLRWEEVDTICRWAALADPSVHHPGPLLALLSRFTPVCETDDGDVVFPLLVGAWQSLGLFDDDEVTMLAERTDCRQGRFQWRESAGWHTLHQPEDAREGSGVCLYSLRVAENVAFPFHDWSRFVAAARLACNAAIDPGWRSREVIGAARAMIRDRTFDRLPVLREALARAGCEHPALYASVPRPATDRVALCWFLEELCNEQRGTLFREFFGSTPFPRRTLVRVEIALPQGQRGLSADAVVDRIGRLLAPGARGWAKVSGSTFVQSEGGATCHVSTSITCQMRGDVDELVNLIRSALAGVPAGTQLRVEAPVQRTINLGG